MNRYNRLLENSNAILSEVNKIKSSLNEKKSKSDIVLEDWKALKNKTKVFETIPLIYAVSSDDDLSLDDMVGLLENTKFDWDNDGKKWLLSLFKKIKGDQQAFETFLKAVVGAAIDPAAPSLKDLNDGKPVKDFIHGRILDFYRSLKKASPHREDSKDFTADVVIFWGLGAVADRVLSNSGGILNKIKPTENSTVILGDGSIMACVSLKALHGRVGKVTALFASMFGMESKQDTTDESIQEGLVDMLANGIQLFKDTGSSILDKIKNAYNSFVNWVKRTWESLKSIFSDKSKEATYAQTWNAEILKVADEVMSSFDESLSEQFKNSGRPLTEATDDTAVEVTNCMREKILNWYKRFDNDYNKIDKSLKGLQLKLAKYKNSRYFRYQISFLDKESKDFKNARKLVEPILFKLQRAKIQDTSSKSCSPVLVGKNTITVTRKELKNILMSNANFIALDMINSMVDKYISSLDQTDQKKALAGLIEFTTKVNAEAIFGGADEIPLVKYDGTKLLMFGSRKNYEKNKTNAMVNYFKSVETLPVIGIKINPPKTGDPVAYYNVTIYMLADYNQTESVEAGVKVSKNVTAVMDKDFVYNVVTMKCNSGSKFVFTVEGDSTTTGDKIANFIKMESSVEIK